VTATRSGHRADTLDRNDDSAENETDPRLGTPTAGGGATWQIRTGPGRYLLSAAQDDAPAWFGDPPAPVDDTALRVWDSAFRLAVRRRFEPETPLAEISRTVAGAVHTHQAAALPVLDAEMLVRDALGEEVPVDGIDPAVRLAVHLLVFASLTDELALGDGELDGLIAQAEELAGAID